MGVSQYHTSRKVQISITSNYRVLEATLVTCCAMVGGRSVSFRR